MVKTISESLIKHGKVVRGYLGVNTEEFSSLISEAEKEGSVMLFLRDGRSGRVGYIIVPLK